MRPRERSRDGTAEPGEAAPSRRHGHLEVRVTHVEETFDVDAWADRYIRSILDRAGYAVPDAHGVGDGTPE